MNDSTQDTTDLLEKFRTELPLMARDVFRDVLGCELEVNPDEWSVSSRISFDSTCAVSMGLGNDNWRSLVVLAYDKKDYSLVPGGDDEELAKDAFGELINTFGGLIAANSLIEQYCQTLTQAPPMFYNTKVTFPKAPSLSGSLQNSDHIVLMGFSLQSAISPMLQKLLQRKSL